VIGRKSPPMMTAHLSDEAVLLLSSSSACSHQMNCCSWSSVTHPMVMAIARLSSREIQWWPSCPRARSSWGTSDVAGELVGTASALPVSGGQDKSGPFWSDCLLWALAE
jgi:hypothetical protein